MSHEDINLILKILQLAFAVEALIA